MLIPSFLLLGRSDAAKKRAGRTSARFFSSGLAQVSLIGIVAGFLLAGCQRKERQTTSPSDREAPATRLNEQRHSSDGAAGRTSEEASGEGKKEEKENHTSADTSSQAGPLETFSEAEVKAAGRIYVRVQEKRKTLQEKQKQPAQKDAPTRSPSRQVQRQMVRVMTSAISEEPALNPPRFKNLMSQAMRDSLLRERFFEAIRKAGGEPPSPRGRR